MKKKILITLVISIALCFVFGCSANIPSTQSVNAQVTVDITGQAASGSSMTNSTRFNEEDYYNEYSIDEINADRESQINLLFNKRKIWQGDSLLDGREISDDGSIKRWDTDDENLERYVITDINKNGKLEIICRYPSYGTDGDIIYEVNSDRNDIYKCKLDVSNIIISSWFRTVYYSDDGSGEVAYKKINDEDLLQTMFFSADGFFVKSNDDNKTDYKKEYNEFFDKLCKKSKNKLYMAIVDSVQPILLVTDKVLEDGEEGITFLHSKKADVYGFDSKQNKIVFIGSVSCARENLRIVSDGIYIESINQSKSERMYVTNGIGYIERINGMNDADSNESSREMLTLSKGKEKTIKSTIISHDLAKEMDYYRWYGLKYKNINGEGQFIVFTD